MASISRQGSSRTRRFIQRSGPSSESPRALSHGGCARCNAVSRRIQPGYLQDKAAQIGVFGEIADVLLYVLGIYLNRLAMAVGGGK